MSPAAKGARAILSGPDLAAVRAALAHYMPNGAPWALAGPANVAARQRLMLHLTGCKVPRAQCGITAIWAAIESAGVPLPGSCQAVRERNLATWIRTGVAV